MGDMEKSRVHTHSQGANTLSDCNSSVIKTKESTLIPGLPNDVACLCLAFLPLWQHRRLKSVCRAWNAALSSKFLLDLRQEWGKSEGFLCFFKDDPSLTPGEVFDPRAELWSLLPPMPCNPYTYGLTNFECVSAGNGLFVIGGSVFDARSFPIDRPLPSARVFRFDAVRYLWERVSDMVVARGSFACGVRQESLYVVGGGSRHGQFAVGGSRISSAERYDMREDRWHPLEGLRKIRAGCTGFFLGDEFWVMGGYGHSRTISGILPVDEYYADGEVLNIKTGRWRELKTMWEEGDRRQLGRVAVLRASNGEESSIFMLENSSIFRYDVNHNRWYKESQLPRTVLAEAACRLVALDGELYVIPGGALLRPTDLRHLRRKRGLIVFQIYNPKRGSWRLLPTKPPLSHPTSIPWGAMCTMRL
ncbi:hypothetical protein O6H91_15G047400 [Diphasiastrum complanatum]|uniref:Uncharacterized protein n=1 Tax=Diphasiastrum complanatum TaxID=34168 RepID=A0ACC2BI07_DIPCM|nr:hypothetical protein O6H91_15G047400 [Diphasiastrum complanatum]